MLRRIRSGEPRSLAPAAHRSSSGACHARHAGEWEAGSNGRMGVRWGNHGGWRNLIVTIKSYENLIPKNVLLCHNCCCHIYDVSMMSLWCQCCNVLFILRDPRALNCCSSSFGTTVATVATVADHQGLPLALTQSFALQKVMPHWRRLGRQFFSQTEEK